MNAVTVMASGPGTARFRCALVVALALAVPAIPAFSQGQYCPSTIRVKQEIEEVPGGWRALNETLPHRLAAITFYDGPPEQNASLVNDGSNKAGTVETWHFQAGSESTWIACSYSFTSVVVARQLPKGTIGCSITYNRKVSIAGHSEIQRVQCRASDQSAPPAATTKPGPGSGQK